MDAPKYQAPPPDPELEALKAKAQADDVKAMSATASIDTASIMARFGTRLAMAGGGPASSPLTTAPSFRGA